MDERKRDSIVATLLSYYEFLVWFYLPEDCIRRPPAGGGGWPQITSERLYELKTDKVVDLLKHIPYICKKREFQIAEHCECSDYAGDPGCDYDPISDCLMDTGNETIQYPLRPGIVTLGHARGRDGSWIFYDTEDDCFIMSNLQDPKHQWFADADELFNQLKAEFISLVLFPLNPHDVSRDDDGVENDLRAIFTKYGWPTAAWRKEEGLAEIEAVQDSWGPQWHWNADQNIYEWR